jgi:hypothetical protein
MAPFLCTRAWAIDPAAASHTRAASSLGSHRSGASLHPRSPRSLGDRAHFSRNATVNAQTLAQQGSWLVA